VTHSRQLEQERKRRLSPPLLHIFRARRNRPAATEADTTNIARPQRAPINAKDLQTQVERDVEALMNHVALDATLALDDFPYVQASILNFGIPDIASLSMQKLDSSGLERKLETALRRYEPRLVGDTLRIARDETLAPETLQLRYVIDSDLTCYPLDAAIEFVADIDAGDGAATITRR